MSLILSGVEFNEVFNGVSLYKIIKNSMIHNNFKFSKGLNIDNNEFQVNNSSAPGGFFFTLGDYVNVKTLSNFYNPMSVWNIEIPDDSIVVIYNNRMKTNKIILTSKISDQSELKFLTKENVELMFKINQNSLICFPDNLKTESMFLTDVINNNPKLLSFVPHKLWNPEICNKIYQSAFDTNNISFRYINDKFKTIKMCEQAILSDISNFLYVPEKCMTSEICEKAVKYNTDYFEYVPYQCMTSEICDIVMMKNCEFFDLIPDYFKTLDMCLKALKYNPDYFEYIPKHLRSRINFV
jgi:hypothetical protein